MPIRQPAPSSIDTRSKNLVSGKTANYLIDTANVINRAGTESFDAGEPPVFALRTYMTNRSDKPVQAFHACAVGKPHFEPSGVGQPDHSESIKDFKVHRKYFALDPNREEHGANIAIAVNSGDEKGGSFLAARFGFCLARVRISNINHTHAHLISKEEAGLFDRDITVLYSGFGGPFRITWMPEQAGEFDEAGELFHLVEGFLDPFATQDVWGRIPSMDFMHGTGSRLPDTMDKGYEDVYFDVIDPSVVKYERENVPVLDDDGLFMFDDDQNIIEKEIITVSEESVKLGIAKVMYDFQHRERLAETLGEARLRYVPQLDKWRIIGAAC